MSLERQTGFRQRLAQPVIAQPGAAVGVPVMADIAEPAIAARDQVAARRQPCTAMRHADCDIDRGGIDIHHLDHPHPALIQHPPGGHGMIKARDQHGRRLPGQQPAHHGFFTVDIVFGDRDHRLQVRAFQPGMDTSQHLGEHDV